MATFGHARPRTALDGLFGNVQPKGVRASKSDLYVAKQSTTDPSLPAWVFGFWPRGIFALLERLGVHLLCPLRTCRMDVRPHGQAMKRCRGFARSDRDVLAFGRPLRATSRARLSVGTSAQIGSQEFATGCPRTSIPRVPPEARPISRPRSRRRFLTVATSGGSWRHGRASAELVQRRQTGDFDAS